MSRHVLLARLDNDGDVLLAGPAVRAVAASAGRVTLLHGPRGRRAAALLPGVNASIEHRAAWIDLDGGFDGAAVEALIAEVGAADVDEALVLTSFHQSPLPLALLLRQAGVPRIAGISDDFPGSLLDVRHRIADDLHEVERNLSLVAAFGHRLPGGDDGRLAIRRGTADAPPGLPDAGYVVVHPGASVPARAWAPDRHAALVDALVDADFAVVVTGGPDETDLARFVAGPTRPGVVDLGGRTTFAELAEVIAGASAAIVGNTGPAHLAAAVGTPVVSLFAATVPAVRWRPWGVAHLLLGDQAVACAGCRASTCPVPGHPCLGVVSAADVVGALRRVLSDRDHLLPALVVR